jgi:hypothetical protein
MSAPKILPDIEQLLVQAGVLTSNKREIIVENARKFLAIVKANASSMGVVRQGPERSRMHVSMSDDAGGSLRY